MHIEVAYSLLKHQYRVHLEMAEGARVVDALRAVSRVEPFSDLELEARTVAVFGRIAGHDQTLQHGDRIDVLRPLLMDPKEARRRRAAG